MTENDFWKKPEKKYEPVGLLVDVTKIKIKNNDSMFIIIFLLFICLGIIESRYKDDITRMVAFIIIEVIMIIHY